MTIALRLPSLASLIALLFASASLNAALGQSCSDYAELLKKMDLSKAKELQLPGAGGATYKSLFDDCDKTNNFAGYSPSRKCSLDKNNVAKLLKFPDKTILFVSKLGVDADGSPEAMSGSHSSTDQPETSLRYKDGSSINAEEVPFVVIPQSKGKVSFSRDSGAAVGDLAAVFRGRQCSIGIVADQGPYFRLGEASLRAHEDLGNPQCAKQGEHPCMHLKGHGSGIGLGSGVTTIIFPDSKPAGLTPETIVRVTKQQGAKRLESFFKQFE